MQASTVSMKNSAEIFEHCARGREGKKKKHKTKNKLPSYGDFPIGNP